VVLSCAAVVSTATRLPLFGINTNGGSIAGDGDVGDIAALTDAPTEATDAPTEATDAPTEATDAPAPTDGPRYGWLISSTGLTSKGQPFSWDDFDGDDDYDYDGYHWPVLRSCSSVDDGAGVLYMAPDTDHEMSETLTVKVTSAENVEDATVCESVSGYVGKRTGMQCGPRHGPPGDPAGWDDDDDVNCPPGEKTGIECGPRNYNSCPPGCFLHPNGSVYFNPDLPGTFQNSGWFNPKPTGYKTMCSYVL